MTAPLKTVCAYAVLISESYLYLYTAQVGSLQLDQRLLILPLSGTVSGSRSVRLLCYSIPVSSAPQSATTALKSSPLRSARSPLRTGIDDGRRTIAKIPPPDSDSDDEVEVIQAICGRPTRSGRIPRPAVRPPDDDVDDLPVAGSLRVAASRNEVAAPTESVSLVVAAGTSLKPVVSIPPRQGRPARIPVTTRSNVASQTLSNLVSPALMTVPPLDVNNLPPGYFVVVEKPSSSEGGDTLYHIFAIDSTDTDEAGPASDSGSGNTPPVCGSAAYQEAESMNSDGFSVVPSPQHASLSSRQPRILDSGSSRFCSGRPKTLSSGGSVTSNRGQPRLFGDGLLGSRSYGQPSSVISGSLNSGQQGALGSVQPGSLFRGSTVLESQPLDDAVNCNVVEMPSQLQMIRNVTALSSNTVDSGRSASCGQHVMEICDDLSRLTNCTLTAMQQPDGTVVIQTTPSTNCVPLPRPPSAHVTPRPRPSGVVPLPRHPSVQPGAEVYFEMVPGGGGDSGQYGNIIVEDSDDFEREECVT